MNAVRSSGQPDLIYVLLNDEEASALRKVLPKGHQLKRMLKKVLLR